MNAPLFEICNELTEQTGTRHFWVGNEDKITVRYKGSLRGFHRYLINQKYVLEFPGEEVLVMPRDSAQGHVYHTRSLSISDDEGQTQFTALDGGTLEEIGEDAAVSSLVLAYTIQPNTIRAKLDVYELQASIEFSSQTINIDPKALVKSYTVDLIEGIEALWENGRTERITDVSVSDGVAVQSNRRFDDTEYFKLTYRTEPFEHIVIDMKAGLEAFNRQTNKIRLAPENERHLVASWTESGYGAKILGVRKFAAVLTVAR